MRGHDIIVLPFPAPEKCDSCEQQCEPFLSRQGCLCWDCLPEEDRRDKDGSVSQEPRLDPQERRDLALIRERLQPNAQRCDNCHERRAASELFVITDRWICIDCRSPADCGEVKGPPETTGVSGASPVGNPPETTITEGADSHAPSNAERPPDASASEAA